MLNAGIKPYSFGRLPINTSSLPELDSSLQNWLQQPNRPAKLVGFINPHVYTIFQRDPDVHDFLHACDLVCVDGVGIALAARIFFGQTPPRVVATNLFDRALDWPAPRVNAILIGGTPLQVNQAAAAINARNGAWRIVAAKHGYLAADAYKALLRKYTGVDAVLVGAGTPKSERILLDAVEVCKGALCWHIGGGTIGVYAGEKRRAPSWVSNFGVEWVHRWLYEPHYRSRIFPGAFKFASGLMKERFLFSKEILS